VRTEKKGLGLQQDFTRSKQLNNDFTYLLNYLLNCLLT
jgi:hypothetical protein